MLLQGSIQFQRSLDMPADWYLLSVVVLLRTRLFSGRKKLKTEWMHFCLQTLRAFKCWLHELGVQTSLVFSWFRLIILLFHYSHRSSSTFLARFIPDWHRSPYSPAVASSKRSILISLNLCPDHPFFCNSSTDLYTGLYNASSLLVGSDKTPAPSSSTMYPRHSSSHIFLRTVFPRPLYQTFLDSRVCCKIWNSRRIEQRSERATTAQTTLWGSFSSAAVRTTLQPSPFGIMNA